MGEDAIERWHQTRMRHHARIKGLRSIAKQKNSQAKCEHTTKRADVNGTIDKVIAGTKRKWKPGHTSKKTTHEERRKIARETTRNRIKMEIENEERKVMSTPRELNKKECVQSHAVQHFRTSCMHSFKLQL